MKRITLYNENVDGDFIDPMEAVIFANQNRYYLTKREQQEHQNILREQKEEYQRRNRTFLSEERKRAWLN